MLGCLPSAGLSATLDARSLLPCQLAPHQCLPITANQATSVLGVGVIAEPGHTAGNSRYQTQLSETLTPGPATQTLRVFFAAGSLQCQLHSYTGACKLCKRPAKPIGLTGLDSTVPHCMCSPTYIHACVLQAQTHPTTPAQCLPATKACPADTAGTLQPQPEATDRHTHQNQPLTGVWTYCASSVGTLRLLYSAMSCSCCTSMGLRRKLPTSPITTGKRWQSPS